jgi:PKD repeat protein
MKKNIFLFAILVFILSGCEKEPNPVAAFTLSNYYPDVNETITATNQSIDAFSYLWNHGDGTESTLTNQKIYYESPGTYTITLTAFSESGEKQNVATESVTVEQRYGDVTFWQSGTPAYGLTVVSIDGQSANITSNYSNGISDCNMSGCANFHLTTGEHSFSASDGQYTWSGSFIVKANQCLKFQLQ